MMMNFLEIIFILLLWKNFYMAKSIGGLLENLTDNSNPRVTNSNPRVTISNWRVTNSNPRVKSSNSQIGSSNSPVTSSNLRVQESLNQWKLKGFKQAFV